MLGMMIHSLKKQEIIAIEILISLFEDIKTDIVFLAIPMYYILLKYSTDTRFQAADFLNISTLDGCEGEQLNSKILTQFEQSEFSKKLLPPEIEIAKNILSSLGNEEGELEQKKLEHSIVKLKKSLEAKREFLKNKNNYYQTICVLIGVVITLVLI